MFIQWHFMSRDEQEPYYEMAREEKRRYDQYNYRIVTYRYSYRSREQKNNGNYLWIPIDPLFGVSFSDILRTILRLHSIRWLLLRPCTIVKLSRMTFQKLAKLADQNYWLKIMFSQHRYSNRYSNLKFYVVCEKIPGIPKLLLN